MVYHYENGSVVRIEEVRGGVSKLVYKYQDTLGELERLYHNRGVELEIAAIREQINHMLDLRNDLKDSPLQAEVDARLKQLTHRLFVLEV